MKSQRMPWVVFGALLAGYAYFLPLSGNFNINSRLALTFAMAEQGGFVIDAYRDRPEMPMGDEAFYEGHYYSDKAPGASALGAAVYWPALKVSEAIGRPIPFVWASWIITVGCVGLLSALMGARVYTMGVRLTGDPCRAYLSAVALGWGTWVLPFGTVFFGHVIGAALLCFALLSLLEMAISIEKVNAWRALMIGGLLGCALVTEFQSLPLVLGLGVYYFALVRRLLRESWAKVLIPPVVGMAIPVGLYLAYNAACFDSPLANAYALFARDNIREKIAGGFMGFGRPDAKVWIYVTLHPVRGFLAQSPVLFLALAGIWRMWRMETWRREAMLCGWAFVVMPVLLSGFYDWSGSASCGARALIPMLPFLALALLFVPAKLDGILAVLAALSIAQMAAVTFYSPVSGAFTLARDWESAGIGGSVLPVRESLRWLMRGHVRDNVGTALGLSGAASIVAWAALVIGTSALVRLRCALRKIKPSVPLQA